MDKANGDGEYRSDTYRMYANSAAEGAGVRSVPLGASAVYPSAPENVQIEVEGRMVSARGDRVGFSIHCRVRGLDSYSFTVARNHVAIEKNTGEGPVYYKELKAGDLPVDPAVPTRMRAVCTGDARQQHLELWLNGQVFLEADDTEGPFSTGGVGLGVAVGQGDNSIVAEFDNLTVREAASG